MGIFEKIKEVFRRLFARESIERRIGAEIVVSSKMAAAIDLWMRCYKNKPPWRYDDTGQDKVRTLNLPAVIASEIARLTTIEFETKVSDNRIDEIYQKAVKDIRENCEIGCAGGGVAFKPVPENGTITVDYVSAENFFPTAYDSNGVITGAVFVDKIHRGESVYTKLEVHAFENSQYTIKNFAFENRTDDVSKDLGRSIALGSVREWEGIEEEQTFSGIQAPLFAYFKMPGANTIDGTSPLGTCCFSDALELIEEADKQWDRILWEFEGSELAIDVDYTWFMKDAITGKHELPKGKDRLFRLHHMDTEDRRYNVFSPEIRDSSLFNGLNRILQRIEFNCGLSYGTLSDPQVVEKTATEILASKQRAYSTVNDIQGALEDALKHLVYAISVWMNLSGERVLLDPEITFNWDDSIIVDKNSELASMRQDVASGILRPEIYLAKKYGVTEEEALEMIPDAMNILDDGFFVADPNEE